MRDFLCQCNLIPGDILSKCSSELTSYTLLCVYKHPRQVMFKLYDALVNGVLLAPFF